MQKLLPILLLFSSLLFAKTKANISLFTAYNKAEDSYFLSYSRFFYGIRAGVDLPNEKAIQFGYEQGNNVNCKGLDLKRFYINGIQYLKPLTASVNPYALLNLGYETSTIHYHKPNQFFVGAGAGVRVAINPDFYSYLEARLHKRLQTGDIDIVMTLGLAYQFDTDQAAYAQQKVTKAVVATPVVVERAILSTAPTPELVEETPPAPVRKIHNRSRHYYIQLGVFAKTNPSYLVRKARRRGYHAKIRHIRKGGRHLRVVLVGPYRSRAQAKRKLRGLRRIAPGAFVTRR